MILKNQTLPAHRRKMLFVTVAVYMLFVLAHLTLPSVLREIISWEIMLGHYGAVKDLLYGVEYFSNGSVKSLIYILGVMLVSGGGWTFLSKRGIVGWKGVLYSIAISFVAAVVVFFVSIPYFYVFLIMPIIYFFLSNLVIMIILSITSANI